MDEMRPKVILKIYYLVHVINNTRTAPGGLERAIFKQTFNGKMVACSLFFEFQGLGHPFWEKNGEMKENPQI